MSRTKDDAKGEANNIPRWMLIEVFVLFLLQIYCINELIHNQPSRGNICSSVLVETRRPAKFLKFLNFLNEHHNFFSTVFSRGAEQLNFKTAFFRAPEHHLYRNSQ